MNTINDKVVVILGASSGIGEATVRLLAGKGAKLVIASRREEKLRELADSLEGCTIAYKTADVASYEEVKAVIDMAVELHGRVMQLLTFINPFKVKAPVRWNWISGRRLIL